MTLPSPYHARRATLDDIEALRALWTTMRFDPEPLARRVTEFQVVEHEQLGLIGAIGFQVIHKQGCIHSEAFTDFAHADFVRPMLWDRLMSLASNHGVVRVWTREEAPFWRHSGLNTPDAAELERLPAAWRGPSGWLTLKLREDLDEVLSGDQEIALFMQAEKRRTEQLLARARVVKTLATVLAFLLLAGVILAAWQLLRRGAGFSLGGG